MPTYVYACKNCSHRFEKYQSFDEDSLRTCPECTQDALRKVFDSVGIVFKGPGFYSTDSSASDARTTGASASGTSGTAAPGGTGMPGAEETVARIREMNERIIETSRQAGRASLDAYERALENLVSLQEQTAGASQLDWVDALAGAHARYVRDVSKAYTDAARSMLG